MDGDDVATEPGPYIIHGPDWAGPGLGRAPGHMVHTVGIAAMIDGSQQGRTCSMGSSWICDQ